MKPEDYRLLVRSFDDTLIPHEKERLDQLMAESAEARAEWNSLRAIRAAVGDARDDSFGPYFADRVMKRVIRPQPASPTLAERLLSAFQPTGLVRWTVGFGFAAAVVALVLWIIPVNIEVPNAETRLISLPDGSEVTLNSGAHLRYARFLGRSVRLVELTGEAYFDVSSDERSFVVETFNARVSVLGTRFNVRAWPQDEAGATTVSLEEGVVDVRSSSSATTVRLEPGQTTRVVGEGLPDEPTSNAAGSIARWRAGEIVFIREPLVDVLRALKRRYDMEFSLDSGDLGTRAVTYLNPSPGSAEEVLADICFSLNLGYRSIAGGFQVVRP